MSVAEHYLTKLEKSPGYKQSLINSWADYIELVCLANIDNEISEEDIIDRLSGRVKDFKEDTDEHLEEIDELEKELEDIAEPSRRAEVSDKWESRVKDYFKILALRQALYDDYYPFLVNGDCLSRKPVLQENHILYIYLLMCSNLYLFDDVTRIELANSFELISLNAFESLLPANATVHLFGKNPFNKKGRFSKGTFWNKLRKLKVDLNEEINPHVKKKDFSEHHTGDEGLDLVGWIPTGDKLSSSIIYFAQCACTYNFIEKQHSSSHTVWAQKITFKNPPSNSTFIPHCFRGIDGTWIKSTDIMYTFLVDRRRILYYYSAEKKNRISRLPIYKTIQEIVELKESIF